MGNINYTQIKNRVDVKAAALKSVSNHSSLPKTMPTGKSTYAPPAVTPVSNTIPKKSGIPNLKG